MSSNPLVSAQWGRFILPVVRSEWYQKMTSILSVASQFYDVKTSDTSVEYSQGIGDFGLVEEYNSEAALGQPGAIKFDAFSPLYEKTFVHKEYAKGVSIDRKLFDDDRKGNIRSRARNLGNSFGTTIATHQTSVFNNAFSSSYPGGDAVALCSTVHPNRPNDASTTFSNKGTSALSYASVIATRNAARRWTDDRGNPFPVSLNVLYVPIELQATAYEIVNAVNRPGTADNDANALKSDPLTVVVDDYLTGTNDWFMLNSSKSREHLQWFWRVKPELDLDPASNFKLVAQYRGYMRYSFGWDDWRWIYGHEVA